MSFKKVLSVLKLFIFYVKKFLTAPISGQHWDSLKPSFSRTYFTVVCYHYLSQSLGTVSVQHLPLGQIVFTIQWTIGGISSPAYSLLASKKTHFVVEGGKRKKLMMEVIIVFQNHESKTLPLSPHFRFRIEWSSNPKNVFMSEPHD